jgi:hypothetical protein
MGPRNILRGSRRARGGPDRAAAIRLEARRRTAGDPANVTAVSAETLSVRERILLFCLASGTRWHRAGVTEHTVLNMVAKGMVDREAGAQPSLTRRGRDTLVTLLESIALPASKRVAGGPSLGARKL